MEPNPQWRPPSEPPPPPPFTPGRRRGTPWLPAAIIGSAIVVAAGLVGGALILKDGKGGAADTGPTTCQAWTETRLTLRAIPALPNGWNWNTPNIDTFIKNQNAPVATALDRFEPQIAADPADVAQAARDYLATRRDQMESLSDRTYTPQDGAAVDTALSRLNELCGIVSDGRRI